MFARRRARWLTSDENTSGTSIEYPLEIESVDWKNVNKDKKEFPKNAFIACKLETSEDGFIAKAEVNWQFATGVTTRNGMVASIPYGSSEHLLHSFQILAAKNPNKLCWHKSSDGNVPKFAVCGGKDRRERLYIGRTCTPLNDAKTAFHEKLEIRHQCDGASRVGKIHPSHHCLYVSYNGREYVFPTYEVLCHKISPAALTAICRWRILLLFHKLHKDQQCVNELPIPTYLKEFLLSKKYSDQCTGNSEHLD